MTINWSSPSNSSLPPDSFYCLDSDVSVSSTTFIVTRAVLVLPFALWVLHVARRRWLRQRSFDAASHSDIITYNMAVMQLFEAPGAAFYLLGFLLPQLSSVGFCVSSLAVVGEILFHLLTCVERHLAVIYPLTYLKLRNATGTRIRSATISAVWLFSLGWSSQLILRPPSVSIVPFLCFLSVMFLVVSFCSVSVLRVLIRPRPGDVGGDRVDAAKRKAFSTILITTAAVWLLFLGYFVCLSLTFSSPLDHRDWCLLVSSVSWFSLPSSLMVPLLFLSRADQLTGFCTAE